jgi:hypothetical protein
MLMSIILSLKPSLENPVRQSLGRVSNRESRFERASARGEPPRPSSAVTERSLMLSRIPPGLEVRMDSTLRVSLSMRSTVSSRHRTVAAIALHRLSVNRTFASVEFGSCAK